MSDNSAQVTSLKILKAIVWVVYLLASAAVIVIAFAFFLLIFNASTQASFVAFIYEAGLRFSQPFLGMLEPTELSNGGEISWTALFAIAAYSVLAWLIGSVLDSISRGISRRSASQSVRPPAAQPQPVAPQAAPQPPASQPAPAAAPQPLAPEPAPAAAPQPPSAAAPADAPQDSSGPETPTA